MGAVCTKQNSADEEQDHFKGTVHHTDMAGYSNSTEATADTVWSHGGAVGNHGGSGGGTHHHQQHTGRNLSPVLETTTNMDERLPSDEGGHSLRLSPVEEGGGGGRTDGTTATTTTTMGRLKGGGLLVASTYNDIHQQASSHLVSNGMNRSTSKRIRPVGVVGMNNMGNTCYLNSSLQCLSATIPLTDYFLGYNYRAEINKQNVLGTKGKLATAYADLMSSIWSGKNLAVKPKAFKMQLSNFAPQFEGSGQHDAQELLALMLDGIHEDLNRIQKKPYIQDRDCDGLHDERDAMEAWKNYLSRNKSIIVDIFQGQMRNCLTCLHCQHQNIRFEPFMYLSLPMTSTCRTLQDCMSLYLAPEKLVGDNQWYCDRCHTYRDALRKTDIWILPPILIVHLKRFKFDDFGNSVGQKNTAAIDYPIQDWNLQRFVNSQSSDRPVYDLYAVSNHFGGMGCGHYTAYAMSRFEDEEWYEFNDNQTRKIPQDALRHNQSAAYLLFYNRRRMETATDRMPSTTTTPTTDHGSHHHHGGHSGQQQQQSPPSSSPLHTHPLQRSRSSSPHHAHPHQQSSPSSSSSSSPLRAHPLKRIPLVRRQSVNRPDLWPHTQVLDHQFREFSRSSVRVMEVSVLEQVDENVDFYGDGESSTFETSLETTREVRFRTITNLQEQEEHKYDHHYHHHHHQEDLR